MSYIKLLFIVLGLIFLAVFLMTKGMGVNGV